MQQIFMKAGSTEYAIFTCFEFGMFAKNPLESKERLGNPDFPLPISFFYGDDDWMYDSGGRRIVNVNKFKGNSDCYTISDCGHHLYLDNPTEFAEQIIYDIFKNMDDPIVDK
jgi:cardiolipin-specific phospholipase